MTVDRPGEPLEDDGTLGPTWTLARALTTASDDTPRTPDEIAAHCAEVLRIVRTTVRQVRP